MPVPVLKAGDRIVTKQRACPHEGSTKQVNAGLSDDVVSNGVKCKRLK